MDRFNADYARKKTTEILDNKVKCEIDYIFKAINTAIHKGLFSICVVGKIENRTIQYFKELKFNVKINNELIISW